MNTLHDTVAAFKKEGRAVGHFNFSDSNQLKAIAMAAKETGLPVIAGLSEGERGFFPIAHARALVDLYCKDGIEMYLNADHTYSLEKAKAAIDDGVDSIVVDGAKLSFDDNAALVKGVVAYAKGSGRNVSVEGELGYIGQGSEILDKLPDGVVVTEETMTKAADLERFISDTGVNMMAPAVGNVHGIIASGQPKLSISHIKMLAAASPLPLVLHGGSGSSDEEFAEAAKAGMSIIHINTDLRLCYRDSLKKELTADPKQTTPYKFLTPSVEAMRTYLSQKMRLFAGR